MASTKIYTFNISGEKDGRTEHWNETEKSKGYRKSWFKTESAARRHLNFYIEYAEMNGFKNVKWELVKESTTIDKNI